MNARRNQKGLNNLTYLCTLALLVAVEFAMKLIGLGSVPVGPLNMSFLTVPIAIGAMLLGPLAGLIMGGVFGLASLYDAITGASVMTGVFFQVSPVNTVVLCVATRMLMGFLTGVIFNGFRKIDKTKTVRYYAGALAAPLLNTLLFMGYLVLAFYQTEFVQNLVAAKGAANPFTFVVLMVGVQGLVEAAVCTIVGGSVAKGVSVALRLDKE
ncbi:MAG: ECF transporter S component [Clostridia bacterium]|nr:ECF transporter S component [Clostridia bacterium]